MFGVSRVRVEVQLLGQINSVFRGLINEKININCTGRNILPFLEASAYLRLDIG